MAKSAGATAGVVENQKNFSGLSDRLYGVGTRIGLSRTNQGLGFRGLPIDKVARKWEYSTAHIYGNNEKLAVATPLVCEMFILL